MIHSWYCAGSKNHFTKSRATSTFLLNFQIPRLRGTPTVWRPLGPAGEWWKPVSSATGSVSCLATTEWLIGVWIHEPLPEFSHWLLPALSHESTAGSIASL